MSKSNPRTRCLICRLVNQMDEVRKHPNCAGLHGITSKLAQIREYTDMDQWCPEHTKNYRDVSCLVEHWAKKLTWQLEERKPAFRSIPKVVMLDNTKSQPPVVRHRFDLLEERLVEALKLGLGLTPWAP